MFYAGGCGGAERPRGTVRLGGGTFGFPSPFAYIAGPGYVQMSYLYDTLVWKDASGRLIPWLARAWQRSSDGLTHTFELRRGVRWHDGRPLTAEDVAFTFDYFAAQSLGPLLLAQPFGVKEARATGPLTVEVVLELPAVTFLASVAGALPIIPRHVWSGIRNPPQAQSEAVLVGTGPYRLASYSAGAGSYLFTANDDYFLGRPFVRRIELLPVDDELVALRAGEIDAAETPPEGVGEDVMGAFRDDPALGIVRSTGNFSFPVIFNLGRGGALADVRFRRACAMALDRDAVVTRLLNGNGEPGNPGFLSRDNPFHAPVQQYPFDPAGANRLLDASGYRGREPDGTRRTSDGRPLRFELLTGNSPPPPVLALLVAAWKGIGVALEPQSVDLPTLFGRTAQAANDIALTLYPGPGGTAPNADPDALRTFYASTVRGRLQGAQGYVDREFDRLARTQLVTSETAERRRLVGRMQEIVARDLVALPLYHSTVFTVFRKRAFDRWYYTPGGFATGLPGVLNKQVLVTGTQRGTAVRAVS